ncbi:ferritin-like domain-containing protein [Zunongwangia endophytica]|uniref:PA2169 family four-helix-bundle protein n=1 Tax=Zunongwangia endophytica TaxID=1808945 RepID=A0ABV8HC51_9FLAO|nr:PA2169 family four-helix-bundle protein [Zunongwangia endophytica]MDN3593897.1 PA2169 family four-helix-bundle protein [Zunongwangia endophytica]
MVKIKDPKSIANALKELLEKNHDAGEVYKDGIEEAESDLLKDFILTQASQRARFAKELERELYQLDEVPSSYGTFQGTLERTWMDIRTIFVDNKDEAILEECLRGEQESAEEYERAIAKFDFSDDVLIALNGQLDEIKYTINKVSNIKDLETY